MLDDLAGKRTGERIQILRERKGPSRPVLAGLVGMSASWLKVIGQGRRLPPRLPVLVKLAEALAVGDVAVLAGTDMDLGGAVSVPVASFARIPHDAVPAIRNAVRDPMLTAPGSAVDVESLVSRTADAWRLWHTSREHRTEVGRILPRLVTDARTAARSAEGAQRRRASAVLAEVYALVQHEIAGKARAGAGGRICHFMGGRVRRWGGEKGRLERPGHRQAVESLLRVVTSDPPASRIQRPAGPRRNGSDSLGKRAPATRKALATETEPPQVSNLPVAQIR